MGRLVIVELARSFHVNPSRFDGDDRLPNEAYLRLVDNIGAAGLRWTAAPDAQATLAALRATYEPLLDGLANRLMLTLPPWMSSETNQDNWQVGHRGLIASRLIEQLSARSPIATDQSRPRLWQRLRSRLDQE
jgi:hypothetical protein